MPLMRNRSTPRAICLALALGACAGSTPRSTTPEQTVHALARALSEGKHEEAYALMSDDYRARVSLEQFKQALGENTDEVLEFSNLLGNVRGPIAEEAIVSADDRELRLRSQGDRWVIESDVATFYDQSTPRAAVHAFVRALSHKRYDVLLRLCPSSDKTGTTAENMEAAWSGRARDDVERMLMNLRAHRDDPIEVTGNRAVMPYGDGMQVQLVREDALWKVEDPE
jgi:hypothetical protein